MSHNTKKSKNNANQGIQNDKKMQSFLDETQKEGKATGKVELKNIDKAMAEVPNILNEDIAEFYRNTPEEDWPTCKMALYSHEIGEIVPAGIGRTIRGKERIVCGTTGSKKISRGREEALKKFYHIKEKNPETEKKSQEKFPPSPKKKNFFKKLSQKNKREKI